jgi:hypothetical protein
MKDDDCEDRAQEQLASLKRDMRKTMEDATVRAMHKVMADFEAKSDERLMEMPEKQPTHCKHKRENGGVCPHHNLQCGWPKCNEPEQPASKPLSGYINRAGINANDSPITVVEKLERAIEASNQETQRKPLTSQERDAQRWRFLMENSYDSKSVTQFHVWEHSWEPHSQTGEPTEWKQRVRGIALIDFIDRAIEAKLKEKNA